MKILAVYMSYFRLPDNFSGNISDALRMMADYHDVINEHKHDCPCEPMPPLDMTLSETFGYTFDEFINAAKDGKRLVGLIQLSDFDPKVKISDL
jgi:hypothetical protein